MIDFLRPRKSFIDFYVFVPFMPLFIDYNVLIDHIYMFAVYKCKPSNVKGPHKLGVSRIVLFVPLKATTDV